MKCASDTWATRASVAMSSGCAYVRSIASRARRSLRFCSSVARLIASKLVQRLAPGGPDDFAADVARVLGGEEHVRGRELARLAGPAERRVGAELRVLLAREAHDHERRPDGPGRDRVDADPALGDLLGEALRERADRALRG